MRTLVFLLILSAGGYWWHYRNERSKQLDAYESDLKGAEVLITDKQRDIDNVRKKLEPLRKNRKDTEAPGGSPESLEEEIAALKAELDKTSIRLDAAQADFEAAMNEVRDHARKQTFPVVTLPSGEELKNCSISKFGEGYISISHDDGIRRIPADDLPDGWAEKYEVNYVSREAAAEKEKIVSKVKGAITAPLDLKKAQLSEIEAKIEELNTEMLVKSQEIRESRRKADQLVREAYRISTLKGDRGKGAEQRQAKFQESDAEKKAEEVIRVQYIALRDEKRALERRRLEIKKKRPAQS